MIRLKTDFFPFKTCCTLFILFNNSKYATIGKGAGFYCDDDSIKKPYSGDTIHIVALFVVIIGVFSFLIIKSVNLLKSCSKINSEDSKKSQHKFVLKLYLHGLLYILGFTELLKVMVTEVRPHFYYTCLPDMSKIDCSKGWISQFNCTGTGAEWLVKRDVFKSFPSGHASLSVYAFVFISMYLYSHKLEFSRLPYGVWWMRGVSSVCFFWCIVCCLTRIMDNRHFWWDVLTGVVIGVVGGLIQIKFTLRKIKKYSQDKSNDFPGQHNKMVD